LPGGFESERLAYKTTRSDEGSTRRATGKKEVRIRTSDEKANSNSKSKSESDC